MKEALAALLGTITGFFLPLLASYLKMSLKGKRFKNAVETEIAEAKLHVHNKVDWLSRDHTKYRAQTDDGLLLEFESKLLYLGEPENFSIVLPFWEHNIQDVIEVTPTKAFNRMYREVYLLRLFESKFREMKLSFQAGGGDPKLMALACYRELLKISEDLPPGKIDLRLGSPQI